MQEYHDNEWGIPLHDDLKLFQMLVLQGMHCGLSWRLVLGKREALREAFDNFDPHKLIAWLPEQIEALYTDERVIRNKLKINMAFTDAKAYFKVVEQYGSLDEFLWSYVDHKPIVGHWNTWEEIPTITPISDRLSADLKKLGFKFVGSTTIYSYMQSVGMVNDHVHACSFRRVD